MATTKSISTKTHNVFKVFLDGKFHQYLMKSESHYISKWHELGKEIKLIPVEMSDWQYKIEFGK